MRQRPVVGLDDPRWQAYPELIARLYAARALQPEEGELALRQLAPPELGGLKAALELLAQARAQQWRVLICGDFDADGATATALLVLALRAYGYERVDFRVPNRFSMGYGLSLALVDAIIAEGGCDLLITVDNGIASLEGVARARRAGMRVLVTDHHLPGASLPEADAIVNPNQPACPFASKHLAGVGVAFYLVAVLRTHLQNTLAQTYPSPTRWLDLVALGTVADVVSLDHNNRILVEHGLRRLRAGECRPGLSALMRVAGLTPERLQASDLGFYLAPRLNAVGRLEDMRLGIEFLLEESAVAAMAMAEELDLLNKERRDIEAGMQAQAQSTLAKLDLGRPAQAAISLYERNFHAGVIGILAGRLKERYHRPVVVFADAEEAGEIKGSARSIAGAHMRDLLAWIDAQSPGLILRFGGHAMAAGLSLRRADLSRFDQQLQAAVQASCAATVFDRVLWHDGALTAAQMNKATARLLAEAGPWGAGMPEPRFVGEFMVLEQRLLQERFLKMTLSGTEDNSVFDAIWFQPDLSCWPTAATRVRVLYALEVNHFRGRERLQLRIEAAQALPD